LNMWLLHEIPSAASVPRHTGAQRRKEIPARAVMRNFSRFSA
jgi:hypothetical protein